MSWDPEKDGIDHVNVYSQGRTELGRLLSNFAHTPFFLVYDKNERFESVEGYWYWLMTGDERLKHLWGFRAKALGKKINKIRKEPTPDELRNAYESKLRFQPKIREMLKACKLPLAHYYVYDGKVVEPKEWQWTVGLWEEFR